jgi:CzcA family heavy metal efflux pump
MELSMITYWKIRERLLRVPGVANIAIWGEQIEIPMVQVDPARMIEHNVGIEDIIEVTSETLDVGIIQHTAGSVVGTGGFIDTPNQRIMIRQVLPVYTSEDLKLIPITDRVKEDGSPLRISDLGNAVTDTWPMIGDAVVNDGPGLLLIIEKFPWANTVEVTHGVEAAMEEMAPGLEGLDIDTTIFRPATFVEVALENLTESLMIGAGLVVVVLLLFLWDWRIAVISATIIPLTMVITLLVLSLFDVTLNVMVLAGLVIAIGAVVDDAIVDVENIVRRLRQYRLEGSDLSTSQIVLEASVEVREAIVTASLIEMTALLPVFFLEGLSGAFFRPLAQAYVVATLVSPFIALTVTPALVLILLSNAPVTEKLSPILPWLHKQYDNILGRSLKKPQFAYVSLVVLMVIGIVLFPLLGQELLPDFKERDFLMHWLTKPGTSHPEMVRISTLACQELRTIPGVRNCGSHIGQALLMDEVYGIYFGENWVSVDPSVDYDETLGKIQEVVDGYPGLYRDVQTYLKERIREVLTGSSHPIVIRVYGQDMSVIRAKADEIVEKLSVIEGLTELHAEFLVDIPQIEVEVDLAKAEAYGIKPGDVRRQTSYMLAGEEVGDIHVVNRTYDVNVWSTPESRQNLTDIQQMLIKSPSGQYVTLEEVARVSIVSVPNAINHENMARRINVEADVEGRDLGSVVAEVEEVLSTIEYPIGYHSEMIGEYAERQQSQNRLLLAGIAATLVIFFLLRLPLALVGGVIAAYLTAGVLSLGSLVGFLTILGVAARNGIMLISHYQHLEAYEGETFGFKLILRGAKERIAPIMMTALTAGLALIPIVIAGNIPGHEIEHPMTIVILGGLITSTLVNLFIVPALYMVFGRGSVQPTAEVG